MKPAKPPNKLIAGLRAGTNKTLTENLAVTHISSESAVLDLFALGGAARQKDGAELANLAGAAYAEDPLLTLKCLFYLRDVRGGQGERKAPLAMLRYLAGIAPAAVASNLILLPEYGRWDDLYALVGTAAEARAGRIICTQWNLDQEFGVRPSLLGKWLAKPDASSKATRANAAWTQALLGLTERDYRRALVALRARIQLVETQMCAQQWGEIPYERVPSKAAKLYRKAFQRHDGARYAAYLGDVKAGAATIHAGTLYPYDLLVPYKQFLSGGNQYGSPGEVLVPDPTVEAQWAALPDYGTGDNALVICDTSGSMYGGGKPLPIFISLSLAIYFAERNRGAFRNCFLTFSAAPELQDVRGASLLEKAVNLSQAHWDGNTNLQAAFRAVLAAAIANAVPPEEMPTRLLVISDMEFDDAIAGGQSVTNLDAARAQYAVAGYALPQVVFWNVQSRHKQVPAKAGDPGIVLVSGASAATFQLVASGQAPEPGITPYAAMLAVLNSERYAPVTLPASDS